MFQNFSTNSNEQLNTCNNSKERFSNIVIEEQLNKEQIEYIELLPRCVIKLQFQPPFFIEKSGGTAKALKFTTTLSDFPFQISSIP